jgi:hypothetical protein
VQGNDRRTIHSAQKKYGFKPDKNGPALGIVIATNSTLRKNRNTNTKNSRHPDRRHGYTAAPKKEPILIDAAPIIVTKKNPRRKQITARVFGFNDSRKIGFLELWTLAPP